MAKCGSKESLSQYIGNFLRKELKAQKVSQNEFAERLNVDPRTVRRWVSGEMHSLEGLQEIATALNIRIRDIISDWDDVPYPFVGQNSSYPVCTLKTKYAPEPGQPPSACFVSSNCFISKDLKV